MKRTRILFVMIQLDAGGSERVVFDIARNLDPSRYRIYVAAFGSGSMRPQFERICEEVFILKKRKGIDFSTMFDLARLVRRYDIDVVNAHHYMPFFYSFPGTRLFSGKRLIYSEHSVPEVEEIASRFHGRLFNAMLYRLSAVVGVSREITARFQERYPAHRKKFLALCNAVDLDSFRGQANREEIRSRWGFSRDNFVVGTIANFRKIKNHGCLLRATARMKDTHPQLRLIFVGTGFPGDPENSEDEVRSQIDELGLGGRVVLTGYQKEVAPILASLDAFCLPSFSEGLPVSLLEAMAAGVPVVGSRVRGIVEVIEHGKTGLLFPCDDSEALSAALSELIENPDSAKACAARASAYIKSNHDSSSWIGKYDALFQGRLIPHAAEIRSGVPFEI